MRSVLIILLLAAALPAVMPLVAGVQTIADFEDGLPPDTEERRFVGQTLHRVVELVKGRVLSATAEGSASGLIFPTRFNPAEWPWLEWHWKLVR